jgi:hypothetical protein
MPCHHQDNGNGDTPSPHSGCGDSGVTRPAAETHFWDFAALPAAFVYPHEGEAPATLPILDANFSPTPIVSPPTILRV